MDSGLYIVTLNNTQPISVNANDPRIADQAIKVTNANCKFGKAQSLNAREQNYFGVFGEHNVNFTAIALTDDFVLAERTVLARLDGYRIRGRTGRKNEWLEGIDAQEVMEIAFRALDELDIRHEKIAVEFSEG